VQYPSADIESDNNPLIGIVKFRGNGQTKARHMISLPYTGKREILKDEFDKRIKLANNNNENENK